MEIDCDIIKDLLPLYAENMTSEKSDIIIKEHLEKCEKCRQLYEDMKNENVKTSFNNNNFEHFRKKIRKHNIIIAVLAVFATVATALTIWGITMSPGDEMGWGLIALYIILPVTAFSCSLAGGMLKTQLKWIIPFVFGLSGSIIPRIVFGNSPFDIIEIFFGFIPAFAGLAVSFIIRAVKSRKRRK